MNPTDPQFPPSSPEPEEEFQPNLFVHRASPGQQYSHTPLHPPQTLEERGFEVETSAMRTLRRKKKLLVSSIVLGVVAFVGGAGYYYLHIL